MPGAQSGSDGRKPQQCSKNPTLMPQLAKMHPFKTGEAEIAPFRRSTQSSWKTRKQDRTIAASENKTWGFYFGTDKTNRTSDGILVFTQKNPPRTSSGPTAKACWRSTRLGCEAFSVRRSAANPKLQRRVHSQISRSFQGLLDPSPRSLMHGSSSSIYLFKQGLGAAEA